MTIAEKLKWVVLPALLVIGLGILEVKFPHAMDGFDDNYTGRGAAGLIVLLIELFLMLTWGKIAGGFAILLGTSAIALCVLSKSKEAESVPAEVSIGQDKSLVKTQLSSLGLRAGKTYVQRRLRNRQP